MEATHGGFVTLSCVMIVVVLAWVTRLTARTHATYLGPFHDFKGIAI